jgi:hypothetical protein
MIEEYFHRLYLNDFHLILIDLLMMDIEYDLIYNLLYLMLLDDDD